MESSDNKVSTDLIISALLNDSQPFPTNYLYFFSDISAPDLNKIKKIWEKISVTRKINLLSDLESLMESDTLLVFDDLAKYALSDNDPNVRCQAISLLWECEDSHVAESFLIMLDEEESESVKLSAAAGLGKFVLLGELDEVSSSLANKIIKSLYLTFETSPSNEIRQEALKSLSYANQPKIINLISNAFQENEPSWQLAAVISMGRSADERWEKQILTSLDNSNLPLQIEAVKAAGELEIPDARQKLLDMLSDSNCDIELKFQIIWSLSKIGGDEIRDVLGKLLEESKSEDEIEIIEMALENLEFEDGLPSLDIF